MAGLLRRGRPRTPWTEPLTATVSPEMVVALEQLSALTGAARTALMRLAVHDLLVRADLIKPVPAADLVTPTARSAEQAAPTPTDLTPRAASTVRRAHLHS